MKSVCHCVVSSHRDIFNNKMHLSQPQFLFHHTHKGGALVVVLSSFKPTVHSVIAVSTSLFMCYVFEEMTDLGRLV